MSRIRKPGRASNVTKHPNLPEIELALANGVRLETIGATYSLTPTQLCRYRQQRMTPERIAMLRYRRGDSPIDLERLKQGESEAIVQRNVTMMAELWHLYQVMVQNGDYLGPPAPLASTEAFWSAKPRSSASW